MDKKNCSFSALLLAPDNFTPRTRTPWGGTKIIDRYKRSLGLVPSVVGESWEISIEPDFPSEVDDGRDLSTLLRAAPSMLGEEAESGGTGLLVKLLDTAAPLSVQIHPRDDDAALADDESGKPESWYILEREEGAGIYIGLTPDATEAQLRKALEEDRGVDDHLTFVPVEPGDFFVIDAGIPHAIGAGVTLVEPQRVLPGRRGVTYRFWDWGRRYDADGHPSPNGKPRTLHVERALAVTDFERARGDALLTEIRVRREVDPPLRRRLSGPGGAARSDALIVERLLGSGSLSFDTENRLWGLTVTRGAVTIRAANRSPLRVDEGRSAVIAANAPSVQLDLDDTEALLTAVEAAALTEPAAIHNTPPAMDGNPQKAVEPRVTIVIPVYNEEAILQTAVVDLVDRLTEFDWPYELILAENGSSDRTVEIAQQLSDRFEQVKYFSLGEPNYGKALRRGILEATGEFVICDEIDLCDTDFYRRAMAILETNDKDLVVGSKLMGGASDERPIMRHAASVVINGMLRVTLGFKGTDTHGLKAFRRVPLVEIARSCLVDKDLFASEFVIRAERGGIRNTEIPVRVLEKRAPSIHLFRRVPRVMTDLGKLFVAIRIKG